MNEDEINFIISEKLRNIIQEEEVVQSKIRSYINKGKSKLYIKQKLFERQESKDLIEKYTQEMFLD
jgi:SOS response regulatory protein OraA/RecX